MTFHTARSPSQAKRFRTCHGSLALCAALPEYQQNQSGEAARIGTCVHALIEHCLGKGLEPESFKDRIIELVGEEEEAKILTPNAKMPGRGRVFYIVDDDMIRGATIMCDYVRGRCKELGVGEDALQLETRTNPLPERDDTSGTADVTIDAWPVLLEVVDYKNGYLTVEHEDNDQLSAYLLGKAIEAGFAHEHFAITVVQPNAADGEAQAPRTYRMTAKDLLAFQKEYRADIKKNEAAENDPRCPTAGFTTVNPEWAAKYLNAGEDADHCTFCDAAPICPARLMLAQRDAEMDFADDPEDLPEPESPADVSRILAWAPRMQKLIAQAHAFGLRTIQNGFEVPGFKAVHGRSIRRLVEMDEKKLVRAVVKEGFVDDAAKLYAKPSLLSGPQMEKLVAPKRRKEFEAKFMVKPPGALTLVPEESARMAAECGPGDDFANEPIEDEMDFG